MAERLSTPEEAAEQPRTRLPTLMEVLNRRTLAPVDLFSFYIYMRDQQRSVDYLDFWLDVSQHLSLCRHYVRELHRSVLVETPDAEKALQASKRSSQNLDSFDLIGDGIGSSSGVGPSARRPASPDSEKSEDQRVSRQLRYGSAGGSPSRRLHSQKNSSGSNSQNSQRSTPLMRQQRDMQQQPNYLTSGPDDNTTNIPQAAGARDTITTTTTTSTTPPGTNTATTSPPHTISRPDIRSSAEKILYTFLLPGSEREIILPQQILLAITTAIEDAGRDDPEVFDEARDYVFRAMERDAFPGFLRAKALGNLVPLSLMLRLVLGLLAIFAAFWTAFTLIFLDYPRSTRAWVTLPFVVGVYALASHQYMLDPVLALAGWSEYTFCSFAKVREPFVRKLLGKRGAVVGWVVLGVAAALVCLFVFVPGRRL